MNNMKFKVLSIVIIAGIGYWLLSRSTSPTDKRLNLGVTTLASTAKLNVAANSVANNQQITFLPSFLNDGRYKNDDYLQDILLDYSVLQSLTKTENLFKDTPNAEDIAIWVSLGKVLDSSPGYGEILNYAFNKINENATTNFSHIEMVIKNLSPTDSFERGQLINLVNMMSLNKEEKIKFFGSELSRHASFDSEGKWSADSLNLTTALIMLKNTNAKNDDVLPYMRESLRLNTDRALKNKLITRFNSYFPGTGVLAEY